ncbi:hypothetical protein GWI33_004068 [Rhynchophorus ferrugineus]|uniref:Uncharacterized protein n=1 Tax=Rhynchophorus ferrugineus TaxID=354439 RepID=A0A834IXM4_RHYFE|nr:hypothetical protein GWI33_004068 [Rhynchophorus ferrugineus]
MLEHRRLEQKPISGSMPRNIITLFSIIADGDACCGDLDALCNLAPGVLPGANQKTLIKTLFGTGSPILTGAVPAPFIASRFNGELWRIGSV